MIPVKLQKEPAGFDLKVRQRGLTWLGKAGLNGASPTPEGTEFPPCWRECLPELHRAYSGICAYLCVYIERVTGGSSVDHFIAKSRDASQAYEWNNYRLACSTQNCRKRDYDDVLDPIGLKPDWFHLELVSGHIYPNPKLSAAKRQQVADTIARLGLDDPECREIRLRRFEEFAKGEVTAPFLLRYSPFVHLEAKRQGLLE
ncbi:MAG: hypothetical protein RL095_2145 [Verrucomicrobiota bacterium]|jgi:uncharacterized protein (TIGR02646 family)